jgi:hypothetical protein
MVDFSTILQTPEIRHLVQENYLERAFYDGLFPGLVYRADVQAEHWNASVGDSQIFTGEGLMPVSLRPLRPGFDPEPSSYPIEQWESQMHQWSGTADMHMPTSVLAIQDLLLKNSKKLGQQAAMTLNRLVRNAIHNSVNAGWTVANGSGSAATSLVVKHLNGFTRARNPNLAAGSRVRYSPVSSSNPLAITIGGTSASVIAATPDVAGDELGPGTLTLAAGVTWSDRAAVLSYDRSDSRFVGGGTKVDDLGPTDLPTLQDIRGCVTALRKNNVPVHPDNHYHVHMGPESEAAIFADSEVQRMNTGVPESYMYSDFVLTRILGCLFVTNNEVPITRNVYPGDGVTFSADDPFAAELKNTGLTSGMDVHRMLFTGFGGIREYYQDPGAFITEAGMIGKMGDVGFVNNGIEVSVERCKMIIRAPLNRLQDNVACTWTFIGDFPVRTDGASPGSSARYKRAIELRHGYA